MNVPKIKENHTINQAYWITFSLLLKITVHNLEGGYLNISESLYLLSYSDI